MLNDLYGKVATDLITLCCFGYMDVDRDFLGNEVDEHFAYDNEGENPFVPVKKQISTFCIGINKFYTGGIDHVNS